jgi:hypothetical protein
MKYFYGQFDGQEFPTQDKLFGFDQLMDFGWKFLLPVAILNIVITATLVFLRQ